MAASRSQAAAFAGFARQQRHHHGQREAARGERVTPRPAMEFGDVKYARARQKRSHVPAVNGERRAGAILLRLQDLDPIGINRDVLGGGHEGHGQRPDGQRDRRRDRIAEPHADDGDAQRHLARQDPGAALTQRGERGQTHSVDQRRPQEVDRIGRRHDAQEPDRSAAETFLAQPDRQRREHQRRRQPTRHSEEEDDRHPPVAVDGE